MRLIDMVMQLVSKLPLFLGKFSLKHTAVSALCLLLLALSTQTHASYSQIQWVDLIPKSDLDALLNPPQSIMDIPEGGAGDIIPADPIASAVDNALGETMGNVIPKTRTPQEEAYYRALKSTNIRAEYNEKDIRIAGFVVPVEYDDNMVITEFFLVPYFGACIHVPPPPPNQIIYVKYPKGLKLDALYTPFWIEGELLAEVVENDLALSAYTLNAKGVVTYDKYKP